MLTYGKLFALIKQRGKNEYYLRKNGISSHILFNLKNGKGEIGAQTIDKVCRLLDCQPGDIMEYEKGEGNGV